MNTVTSIANAIAEVSKVIGKWMASAERRKMSKAIDAGEKYILISQDKSLGDKIKKRKLNYYKRRFFKYNN